MYLYTYLYIYLYAKTNKIIFSLFFFPCEVKMGNRIRYGKVGEYLLIDLLTY